jgi:hypothetical protein
MITEQMANIYEKIDSIPANEEQHFATFVLIGVLAIHHHHHIEETLICGFLCNRNLSGTSLILLFPVPKMEPEFTSPALEEHALFTDTLDEFEEYLMAVLAMKKDSKGSPIPDPTKTKIPYDRKKVIELLDKLLVPLFDHVSLARQRRPARNLMGLDQLSKEIGYLDPAKIRASGLSEQRLNDISASVERHVQSEVVSACCLCPTNPIFTV